VQTKAKQTAFLDREPPPQLIIAAVGQTTYEVRDVIIAENLSLRLQIIIQLILSISGHCAIDVELSFFSILVNFLYQLLLFGSLVVPVRVTRQGLQMLEVSQSLKTVQGQSLEISQRNEILGRRIVHIQGVTGLDILLRLPLVVVNDCHDAHPAKLNY